MLSSACPTPPHEKQGQRQTCSRRIREHPPMRVQGGYESIRRCGWARLCLRRRPRSTSNTYTNETTSAWYDRNIQHEHVLKTSCGHEWRGTTASKRRETEHPQNIYVVRERTVTLKLSVVGQQKKKTSNRCFGARVRFFFLIPIVIFAP